MKLVFALASASVMLGASSALADPTVSEVRFFLTPDCPQGWVALDGQRLSASANSDLYAAIGCNFGSGCGSDFPVPDLRGRTPMGGADVGATTGTDSATLDASHIPPHNHGLRATSRSATLLSPEGADIAALPAPVFRTTGTMVALNEAAVSDAGSDTPEPVNTRMPGLGLTACMAATGTLPQR